MLRKVYFFDSYAIIEILRGNKTYEKYTEAIILTTKLNLFEVYYGLLKDEGEEKADIFLNKYNEFVIGFDKGVIREAARFRLENKKKNLSMTDCIGYCLARKWGIKFLSGDKEFRGMEEVEWVR